MGSGKTLFSTLYALEYSRKNPNNKIYANYSIKNIQNFIYSKFGFLPFSELNDCLIILDDFLAVKQNLQGYLQIIANSSRKNDIDIILTAQYYTFIPPSIRILSKSIAVRYFKNCDTLLVHVEREPQSLKFDSYKIGNAVKLAQDHYDTREIVSFATESDYIAEILKISKNREDIERNVALFTQSEEKRKKILQKIDSEF